MTTELLSPSGLELEHIHARAADLLDASFARAGVVMAYLPDRDQDLLQAGVSAGVAAALEGRDR